MPCPGAGGFVQFLDPSEPGAAVRLEATNLFAHKAMDEVEVRFEAQSWAWREWQSRMSTDKLVPSGKMTLLCRPPAPLMCDTKRGAKRARSEQT